MEQRKKVFVSGCYDMLHSGHVAFFKAAAQYGDLYVGIGSDATILELKHRKTIYSEKERLYMVKSIRYVTDAFINPGSGYLDFVETVDRVKPDIFVVNTDGGSEDKRRFCAERGIEYVELERIPDDGLEARSTTSLRTNVHSQLPYRLDLAGTWIDQPYVSEYGPGWAITISLEPTMEFMERGGMSTSTRKAIQKIWPYELPNYDEEMLAKLVFCFENEPTKQEHVSGAQDAIGICMSGLNRHYYDRHYWPEKIERCHDEKILTWLEEHICLIAMYPRPQGTSVIEGCKISTEGVKALSSAAADCWTAIMNMDLQKFAQAYQASFEAQIAMFPAMMSYRVKEYIDKYRNQVLAWKMSGAGGGGYLAVVYDGQMPEGGIPIKIRRRGMQ
jgi:cytidyltransferase-like protein